MIPVNVWIGIEREGNLEIFRSEIGRASAPPVRAEVAGEGRE